MRLQQKEQLKYVAWINDESLPETTPDEYEIQYIDISNVDSQGKILDVSKYNFIDAPSRARRIAREGDIIISTVRTYLQAIALIENPPDNLIVSTGFAVVRPDVNILNSQYCKYALREVAFIDEVVSRSVGVSYPAINASDLGYIKVHVPPIPEQRAIAAYLDRETARIDTLIDEYEQLQTILAEKRQTLITHAITHGLKPDVPMRDSGIEWLGEIPEHWDVEYLKNCISLRQANLSDEEKYSSLYVGLENIESWTGRLINKTSEDLNQVANQEMEFGTVNYFEQNDILFGKLRPYLAKAHLAQMKGVCSTEILVFNPNDSILSTYLFYNVLLKEFIDKVDAETYGAKMPRASWDTIQYIPIPLPPLTEQHEIVEYIQRKTKTLDDLYEETKTAINLLKEKRISLISAAVTGQIDVSADL